MAAPKGNKFAEKWTEETVLVELQAIQKEAKKNTCHYLGTALSRRDLYPQIWSDWKTKFKKSKQVSEAIKAIESKLESKLFEKALSGDVNTTAAIFGLKNNHGWTDKQETTLKGDSNPVQIHVHIDED